MRAPLLIFILLGFTGCGSIEGNSLLLRTSLGPTLKNAWDSHGGLQAWKKHAGVSLDYHSVINGEEVHLRDLVLTFRSPASLWEKRKPEGLWIRCPLDSSAPGQKSSIGSEEHLAKLSLALLFHLPFSLNSRDWTLRQALQGGGSPGVEFEATRNGEETGIGPFLLSAAPGDGKKRGFGRVHYLCRHNAVRPGVYRVELSEYRSIQGVLVATKRRHYLQSKSKKPFALPGEGLEPEWIENLSGIRFLSDKEVEDVLGSRDPETEEG